MQFISSASRLFWAKSIAIKVKALALTGFLFISTQVIADDSAWDICAIAGYYLSTDDLFLGGLAMRRAERANISCLDNYRDAYFFGKEISHFIFKEPLPKGGDPARLTQKQRKIFEKAISFQEKVNDVILNGFDRNDR